MELMQREEPLLPELQPYTRKGIVSKTMLHHPLIIEMFLDESRAALVNMRYQTTRKRADEAKAEGKWDRYVFSHERPYRLEAMLEVPPRKLTGQLVRQVWVDSENIDEHLAEWRRIWHACPAEMSDDERDALSLMPEHILVYRGARGLRAAKSGLSWTPTKSVALWFANRFQRRDKYLASGRVHRDKVWAYLQDREEEIVLNPRFVIGMQIERV
jgi:hypothetical protein